MEYNKYQEGKIYKIVNNVNNIVYIGSTCGTLQLRFNQHLRDFKRYLNGHYGYVSSFKLFLQFGVNNCHIVLISLCQCNNQEELLRKEGEMIKLNYFNCVNRCIAGRTRKEYMEQNELKIKQQKNYKCVCSCGGKYTNSNKAIHCKTLKHLEYINPKPKPKEIPKETTIILNNPTITNLIINITKENIEELKKFL